MKRVCWVAVGFLTWAVSCGSPHASRPPAYFSASGRAPGWIKTGATREFPASRLSEHIDGDADRYLKAGVEQALTSDYRYRDRIEATADIFVMRSVAGATQVFESQPANGSKLVQAGDAARLYSGTLIFRKGRFFVRLVAYQDVPEVPDALLGLARAMAPNLK